MVLPPRFQSLPVQRSQPLLLRFHSLSLISLEVVFGEGVKEKIGAEAKGLDAKKALVVTDATIEKRVSLKKWKSL